MSDNNSIWGDEAISRSDLSLLFPVDGLDADTRTGADAVTRLNDADRVLGVHPNSLATGYYLTQHELTVIDIDTLPVAVERELEEAAPRSLDAYDCVQVGRDPRTRDSWLCSALE